METKLSYSSPESTTTYSRPYRVIYVGTEIDIEKEMLKQELLELHERIASLEKKEEMLLIRDIPRKQAKQEIVKLLKSGKSYYYSEIVEKLQLDLELVVDICSELMGNGELAIDEKRLATG
jgi:hypothetical protein